MISILRGDARSLPLPDACIDLILTSPPYWQLRSYSDQGEHYEGQIGSEPTPGEYLDNLLNCTREWMRVLKPTGSIFINLGDKYANDTKWDGNRKRPSSKHGKTEIIRRKQNTGFPPKSLMGLPWRYAIRCIDELGLILRAEIIWEKVNGLPESVTDRVRRSHEQVFHFTKQQKYFSAVDEIREPHTGTAHDQGPNATVQVSLSGEGVKHRTFRSRVDDYNPLGKLPGSVWSIPSSPLKVPEWVGVDHFAAYPPELCRRIILGWSPKEICGKCHEGRFPVSNREVIHLRPGDYRGNAGLNEDEAHGFDRRAGTHKLSRNTILGYACACTPYTDHKGTGESTTFKGRYSEAVKAGVYEVLGNRKRTGPWREYHLDDWDAPETTPGVICDPFGGTGTSAMVADVLGRDAISVDMSADYCKLASWRVHDPVERAKVLKEKISRKDIPPRDQPSLFEEM